MDLKNIAAFGCSSTFGNEFPDADASNNIPSKSVYVNHIKDNTKIFNYGIVAASSDQILSKILSVDLTDIDLVIVMWTGISRLTFYKDNFPLTFLPNSVVMFDQDKKINQLLSKKFKNNNSVNQFQEIYDTLSMEKKFLFNNYFKNILLAQEYLKSLNKNFYFTALSNIFSEYKLNMETINSIKNDTHSYYDKIDKSKFFFPENLGFYQWGELHKYKRFPNRHLMEDAYKNFGNLFSIFINNNTDTN